MESILIFVFCSLILCGCPNPKKKIQFRERGKLVDRREISLISDSLDLFVLGVPFFGKTSDTGGIGFDLIFAGYIDTSKFMFSPESVEVWLDDDNMNIRDMTHKDYGYFTGITHEKRKTTITYSIEYIGPKSMLYNICKADKSKSDFIKIYFGRAIKYEGKYLEIDTIRAWTPIIEYYCP